MKNNWSVWTVVFLLFFLAALTYIGILLIHQPDGEGNNSFLGLSGQIWTPILISMLASALFAIITVIANYSLGGKDDNKQIDIVNKHICLVDNCIYHGITYVFNARGGDEANKKYSQLLKKSEKRIWMVCIHGQSVINAHREVLIEKITNNPDIDIKICILDRKANNDLILQKYNERDLATLDDFISDVKKLQPKKKKEPNFKVFEVFSHTYFTSFIIDDTVFFSPYITPQKQSSVTPTIQSPSESLLGKEIISHYESIFKEGNKEKSQYVKEYKPPSLPNSKKISWAS